MSSDTTPDRSAADGYLQRAQLLAELGRYDEAADELGYAVALDPANSEVLTALARIRLAAGRAAEAFTAAESAVAAAPGALPPLVARGLALLDLGDFKAAAATADELLGLGPADAYAQRSAAAILASARNGQQALNAAWRGVELAPEEPQAHLVLGLVAANMRLFDLAERAYREALRLDPRLAEARHDIGVIRLEQRRWSEALEHLAEAAAVGAGPVEPRQGEPGQGESRPGGPGPIDPDRVAARRTVSAGVRQLVVYGAGWSLLTAVLLACMAAGNSGLSRFAAAFAALGGGLLVWRYAAKLPGPARTLLPELVRADRTLALAVYAVAAAPVMILLYALVGSPWPLVLAIVVAALAELAVFTRPTA
ncbi:tetratricopeptide repeat protein [Micromonospora sp. PLK6-60]|uniref:tetratricopeptide repeat protein n=1 Tax=Micromonospora sp. PLK6-60 TaxID=2873383 RepID=UPI001CA6D41C|nr:tetratricopeptide repeat protein [Micromonospora sp. PLK6-60]MBY8873159.1 tetratricopeptide repeat protein [Micromonospora sp. PLK6-60]